MDLLLQQKIIATFKKLKRNMISNQSTGLATPVFQKMVIFFEGHIPSKYITQFLSEEHPNAIGLSVPGMPLGSPGMEVEGMFTPYDVLILFKDGTSKVYAEVRK